MSNYSNESRSLQQKDREIEALHEQVSSLSAQLQNSLQGSKKSHAPLSPHVVNVKEVTSNNKRVIQAQRQRIGRNASIATRRVLETLPDGTTDWPVTRRVLDMFQRPTQHMEYLNSDVFAKDVLKLTKAVRKTLETEPRVVFLQSPCYVFGDIHGNLEDLHFFSDNIWRLGMSLTAGNFLFLGDYVDRGMNCLETIAYLFAMKHQLPSKVFLLRGNHETRDVNGWEEHYGERSFIWQCRNRFGDDIGYRVWEACNSVFDRLPLAAVVDQDIFCVHGGIPRPIASNTTRIQDILTVPKVAGINPPYEHEDDRYQQVASDCIWSDPASEHQEVTSVDPHTGYGDSLRGGGAICFGNKAVTDFLHQQDYSYIMRAHEAHAEGVAISKGARVFTVFSTSQDHNQGSHAMAGCMLVDNEKLQVINRSPAYKNQYIHRRDSFSVSNLSEKEIQKRIKLGLVTNSAAAGTPAMESEEVEWDDLVEGDDEDGDGHDSFVFDTGRRSSVEIDSMSTNVHDQQEAASGMWSQNDVSSIHQRSRKPMVASICEAEEEETATVDGDDEMTDARC